MKKVILIFGMAFCYLLSFSQVTGTVTDSRDGKVYKTVKIGNQTWMAENLNYASSTSCCYIDSTSYCATYGRLYTWTAATLVCPSGWHLPSNAEWTILSDYLGGQKVAGDKLKSTSWESSKTVATNSSGFSALPGGKRVKSGAFVNMGSDGYWWSSDEWVVNEGYYIAVSSFFSDLFNTYENGSSGSLSLSVRCIKE